MSFLARRVRLAEDSSALGLNCTAEGLTLAGAPLLRKTVLGFEPRTETELRHLLNAAYGDAIQPRGLVKGVDRIAQALSCGELGRAMIMALHLGLPDLDWEAGARVARANDALAKFDAGEPRDWHGRWTSGAASGDGPANSAPPPKPANARRRRSAARRRRATLKPTPTPARHEPQKPRPVSPEAKLQALQTWLKAQFDLQTPEQFADHVYRFGDWLERNGTKLGPADRRLARAEYDFLQGGLEFWLAYKAKSANTHSHLLSAAVTLYMGAINSGVVGIGGADGGLPRSYMAAGLAAEAFGGASPIPKGRAATVVEPFAEDMAVAVAEAGRNRPGLGGMLDNEQVGVKWNGGVEEQGLPFEDYVARQLDARARLEKGAKTWDFLTSDERAISCKTLNTTRGGYAANPSRVFAALKGYVDAAADYKPRTGVFLDVDPSAIKEKEIQLGVPEYTSDAQWSQIKKAIAYADGRDVKLVITRIR